MNKDQVKGAIKEAAGKMQEVAGKAIGSKEHQERGQELQVEGAQQRDVGDVKEAVRHAANRLRKH